MGFLQSFGEETVFTQQQSLKVAFGQLISLLKIL